MDSGNFASLDDKIAAGVSKVAHGTIDNAKEKFAIQEIFTKGRRALKMIYDHREISETYGALLRVQDL